MGLADTLERAAEPLVLVLVAMIAAWLRLRTRRLERQAEWESLHPPPKKRRRDKCESSNPPPAGAE